LNSQYSALYYQLLKRLSKSWQISKDKPDESPEKTLHALWLLAAGISASVDYLEDAELPALTKNTVEELEELIRQRITGVPLAHLTNRQQFMDIEMLAGPEALIARKETEILTRNSLNKLKDLVQERGRAKIIDLCTGSGNIALSLAYHEPECTAYGGDLSSDAIGLARRNAQYLKLTDRVDFRVGDMFAPFDDEGFIGQMDMVTCNPPYIASANVEKMPAEISEFEPRMAFDGGPYGVAILFRLIREAPRYLKPNSWLCFEVGVGQGDAIASRLEKNGIYQEILAYPDNDGNVRALLAQT
jgi:release factor glutamine methyltransferase